MPGGFNAADCKNPACGSKMDMFSKSLARAQSTGAAPPPPVSTGPKTLPKPRAVPPKA